MKFINPKVHGVLDYVIVFFLFTAPSMFDFTGTDASQLAYLAGGTQLLLSLMTAYPLGVIRAIPFPIHGMVELLAGFGLVAAPWLMGYAEFDTVRNIFVGSGLSVFALWTTTNYRATLRSQKRRYHLPAQNEEYSKAA